MLAISLCLTMGSIYRVAQTCYVCMHCPTKGSEVMLNIQYQVVTDDADDYQEKHIIANGGLTSSSTVNFVV